MALQDVLLALGALGSLASTHFAESNLLLADAVERWWRTRASYDWTPAYVKAASDVWDLVRTDAAALRQVLDSVPRNALLLIVAGSPCQQLTSAGTLGGSQGLRGQDSILFYAVPTIARLCQDIRPDISVHVLVENAGSTQQRHKHAMLDALGLPHQPPGRHIMVKDSIDWTAMTRRRVLISDTPNPDAGAA
jgi:hypothetical protein